MEALNTYEVKQMIKITDPTTTKVIDVDGTKVTIKPLRPEQRRKAYLAWGDLKATPTDDTEEGAEKMSKFTVKNVNRDELAALIEPGVVSIEGYEGKSMLDNLIWMDGEHFWQIVFAILPYTGMDEEEVKNSPSSSEQDTQASPTSVEKLVEAEEEPASTTKTE